MRRTLFEGLIRGPLTEPAPLPDDPALAERFCHNVTQLMAGFGVDSAWDTVYLCRLV
jgi:hypothetical protein